MRIATTPRCSPRLRLAVAPFPGFLIVAGLLAVCLAAPPAGAGTGGAVPTIRFTFDEPAGKAWPRNSGNAECRIESVAAERVPRGAGGALRITGPEGLCLVSPVLETARTNASFLFFCEFRISQQARSAGARVLAASPGLFLLRLDPEARGGNLSLFVRDAAGRLEPRISAPRPVPGVWHQAIAVRTPATAHLWLDGREFHASRSSPLPPAKSPARLIIGGRTEWGNPFPGLLDNVLFQPAAAGRPAINRLIWSGWTGKQAASGPGKDRRRAWRFPQDMDAWVPRWGLRTKPGADALILTGPPDGVLVCDRMEAGIRSGEGLLLDLEATSGCAAEVVFVTDGRPVTAACPLVPDARRHTVFAPFRPDPERKEQSQRRVHGLVFRPFAAAGGDGPPRLVLHSIAISRPPRLPALPVLELFAPERRFVGLNDAVGLLLAIRNAGGTPLRITAIISLPPVAHVLPDRVLRSPQIAPGQVWRTRVSVRSPQPLVATARLDVTAQAREGTTPKRNLLQAECRFVFTSRPLPASRGEADARRWLSAGFPRMLDFRHLGPDSLTYFEPCTGLLVDMIGEKIAAAREFKRRYPDRFVLMQINDEPNGIWGTWFCVPAESARKQGLRVRPEIFPSPEFRGWWLLDAGTILLDDFPASAEEAVLHVEHPDRLIRPVRGREMYPDVLLYARTNAGNPEWQHSEYASVVAVDRKRGTAVIRRWPRTTGVRWFSYRARQTVAAASSGDIYSLGGGKWIRTWVPNLTAHCPRDPTSGRDAAEWLARHYARVWRTVFARSSPHPDGFEFDWTSFRFFNVRADCNNDLTADACEENGLSLWAAGLHRFFRELRSLLPESALILADSSNTMSQRSFGLLNGSENEEFLGFHSPTAFSTQYDLLALWLKRARPPRISYIQSRFPCEWFTDNLPLARALRRRNFRGSNVVRLALAASCLAGSMHTYRTGLPHDIQTINRGGGPLRYDWDEYHAGRLYRRNWLGLPRGPAHRVSAGLSPIHLPAAPDWTGWQLITDAGGEISAAPLRVLRPDGSRPPGADADETAMEVRVTSIRRTRPPLHAVGVISPPASLRIGEGEDITVEFEVRGEWPENAPAPCREIPRSAAVQAVCGMAASPLFRFLIFPKWRSLRITMPQPRSDRPSLQFLCGDEPGILQIRRVRLYRGSGDVFWREFDHGLVLVNGGRFAPFRFDLEALTPGKRWARLPGTRGIWPNTGKTVGRFVDVPAFDALFLIEARIVQQANLSPISDRVIVTAPTAPRPAQ